MPTARVRASHSHSSLSSCRRLFQLHTSKSSTFLHINTENNGSVSGAVSRTFQFNLPPLPKKFTSRDLISVDTFLKKKPSSIIRRMLALDSDAYRTSQPDIEYLAIESESDDDATLVAGLHAPLLKELEHYEAANAEQVPSIMIAKKICDYPPDSLDEDGAEGHEEPTAEAAPVAIETPPPSPPPPAIHFWSPRNEIFDAPGFKIVEEDDTIVHATALSPPPWHRSKESMLDSEPASPDDEARCPTGEPIPHFSW